MADKIIAKIEVDKEMLKDTIKDTIEQYAKDNPNIVEVVRCKECKYQSTEPCCGGTYQACIHDNHEGVDGCYPNIISQDWFCADGEKRDIDGVRRECV